MKNLIVLLLLLFNISLFGQKRLPSGTSKWAPANINIDGKAAEYNYKYDSYNAANKLYYTICNDDKNLYVIIHTNERTTINKIYIGGITFRVRSFDASVKKPLNANTVSITYPIIKAINNMSYQGAKNTYDTYKRDSIPNKKNIKDLIELKNNQFVSLYKEISVTGVKEFEDPVISIYNVDGIKARTLFDDKFAYTCEFALPLKYLTDQIKTGAISYNIQLNGRFRDDRPMGQSSAHLIRPDGTEDMSPLYAFEPTDFNGLYTLAKK